MSRTKPRDAGIFITLEGLDGTGKTTQLALLADHLRAAGHTVRVTEEPAGTPLGRAIRGWLQGDNSDPPVPRAELLLFLAARAQHVDTLIEPALAAGHTVLCSRFTHSTLAYQCAGLGLDEAAVRAADAFATAGRRPDLVLVLDSEPAAAARRRDDRSDADRIERRAAEFHERVRQGFRHLAAGDQTVRLIDASGTVEEVGTALREAVAPWV